MNALLLGKGEMSCGQSLSVLWLWQLKLASAMIQCNCIHHPCTIRCRLALFGTLDTNVSARIWFATTTKLFHITSSNKKKYRISASNNVEWINGLSHFTWPFILAISQTFADVIQWLRFFGKLFRNSLTGGMETTRFSHRNMDKFVQF